MNLLVCIAKSIETTAKIDFVDNNTALDESALQYIMNPYDEWYALVRALELKEETGGSVTVLHVGDSSSDPIIRKALAIGADQAVRIDYNPKNADEVAQQMAAYLSNHTFDLIFMGKETVDYNTGLTPSFLAGRLGWPLIANVSHFELKGDKAEVTREIEGGVEVLSGTLPLIVSATKGLAEQKIPNMRGIMMAKRKPLEVVPPTESATSESVVSFSKPEKKSSVTLVDADKVEELVRLLHEEAKVI